jgi:hypothetical protein
MLAGVILRFGAPARGGASLTCFGTAHLAAAENGFDEIFTNDRHMLAACAAFGLDGRNLIA